MVSLLAIEDIAQLRADGVDVPPREVIRLNALGLKVERGTESADVAAAPRVAFLSGVVFSEPTLGAEMWLRATADTFNADDEETYFTLRVVSCVIPWRELPEPTNLRAVEKTAKETLEKLRGATYRQVMNALDWVIYGDSPELGEKPPPREADEADTGKEPDELPARYSPEYGLFYRGMAARIGTAEDLKDLTYSAMLRICEQAERLETASAFNSSDRNAEHNKALGDYARALEAVREAAQKDDEEQDGAQEEGAAE